LRQFVDRSSVVQRKDVGGDRRAATRGLPSRVAAPPAGLGAAMQLSSLPLKAPPNRTGLPDHLKTATESLSGLSLDDVRVRYNSPEAAPLQAAAFARGREIHLAPGQERHLPHETWHVVQQKQGRVRPTLQLRGGVPANDDRGLEREADVMGARAAAARGVPAGGPAGLGRPSALNVVQRVGGRKFGLKVSDVALATQAIHTEGLEKLKVVRAAYKQRVKSAKEMAHAAYALNKGSPAKQATYTEALKQAEMTPAGLIEEWLKLDQCTFVEPGFFFRNVEIATVKTGNDQYFVATPAAAGVADIYKRHTLEGPSADEYVDFGGEKLRRMAYRGITPPEAADLADVNKAELTPLNFGKRTGNKPPKYDDAGKKKKSTKDSDLTWLRGATGAADLAQTPDDPKSLAFLQTRMGAGKLFSGTSTPKAIASNQGDSFNRFGQVQIDLARVPQASVLHHYKSAAFTPAAIQHALGLGGAPSQKLIGEAARANESVVRNREVILGKIPKAAVTLLPKVAAAAADLDLDDNEGEEGKGEEPAEPKVELKEQPKKAEAPPKPKVELKARAKKPEDKPKKRVWVKKDRK
jgi:hypothetical protein